jgi:hypothetical protein
MEMGRQEKTVNPPVVEPAVGKPLFKASDGGRFDILREGEDPT